MKKVYILLLGVLLLSACSSANVKSPSSDSSNSELKSSQAIHTSTTEEEMSTGETTEKTSIQKNTENSIVNETGTQETANTSVDTGTTTSDEAKEEKYYRLIKKAWQEQKDYVDSITDAKVKQSVQTPFAAANAKANQLEMENSADTELITTSLNKVLNGQ